MDSKRRKRIDLYKKIIVTFVMLSIFVPLALCVLLLCKVVVLKQEVESLEAFQNSYYAELQTSSSVERNEQSTPEPTCTPYNATSGEEQTPQSTQGSNTSQSSVIETPPESVTETVPSKEPVSTGESASEEMTPEESTTTEEPTTEEPTTEEPTTEEPTTEETTTEEETTTVDTRKKVYLTFDDGPSSNTNAILDILKEYDAKATFFVNGKNSEVYADTYRRIVEEGHTLAMHSYTHVYAAVYASVDAFMEDMHRLRDYLYEITGVMCDIYRFPGGSSNSISKIDMREFGKALAEEGIVYFDWNVESRDAVSPPAPAETIYNNVVTGVVKKNTPVVLMHDMKSKATTVEALPQILQFLIDNDYNMVALDTSVTPVQHVKLNTN